MKKTHDHRVPFWKNPRFRYGGVSTMILCVLLLALYTLIVLQLAGVVGVAGVSGPAA